MIQPLKKITFFLSTASLVIVTTICVARASDPLASLSVIERSIKGKAKGFKLGNITVMPVLLNGVEYSSNIFQSDTDTTDDIIYKTRLNILAASNQGQKTSSLNLQGDYWLYDKTDDLNRGSYEAVFNHNHQLSPVASLGFRLEAEKDYQTSYDAATSQVLYEPIEVDRYGAAVDFRVNPGSINWKFSMGFNEYSFEDTTLLNSSDILVQRDRDKKVYDASVTANFEKWSEFEDIGFTPFIGLKYQRENYNRLTYQAVSDSFTGRDRSNTDYDLIAGIDLKPNKRLRGTLKSGVGYYTPDSSSSNNETTTIVDIDLTYLHTPLTNFLFGAQRYFNTDTDNSEVAIQTDLDAKVIHELTRRWILKAGIGYSHRDFDNDADDELWDGSLGFRHHLNDRFSIDGTAHFISRNGKTIANDFEETRAMLRLRTKL